MKLAFVLALLLGAMATAVDASTVFAGAGTGHVLEAQSAAAGLGPSAPSRLAQSYQPPIRGGVGSARPPRDSEVPLPGSGGVVQVPASVAASDTWTGCRPYTNRFKEPFQRCCSVRNGLRSCLDRY